MIRRPPRSTLFPTRRSSDLKKRIPVVVRRACLTHHRDREVARSEEHTSELQSPDHLVCRLLLEKKRYYATGTMTAVLSCSSALSVTCDEFMTTQLRDIVIYD